MLVVIVVLIAAPAARAEFSPLIIQSGYDMALSFSSYEYQEPGLMSSKGIKEGLDLRATRALENEQFIRGELRYAFGTVDYNSDGSGSAMGEPDWYIETRVLIIGKDWLVNDAAIAPYIGFGYRYLFNDARGSTSAGYWGYRRESNYIYLPIGFIHRTLLTDHARLVSTLEYDHLLAGKQISRLSDGGYGHSDVTNKQTSGYGLKLNFMYEQGSWAIGPYTHFWNIGKSDWVPWYRNGIPVLDNYGRPLGGVEPQNTTVEFGLKSSYKF